ncbi:MAG TPA: pyridoxamine 5'-phosphate oxidase family protein [Dehalococcoidia bacterium]|nr:pyridoxamine 5'-phosphate oxidase family protein [Dehalococcoidia bacterium]
MANWLEFEDQGPRLADAVRGCFEASREATMATLRKDGSPRISGIETLFWRGDLWLGMMPGSRKVADLERDPRLALHSATGQAGKTADAKLSGRAIAVQDTTTIEAFREEFRRSRGEAPDGPIALFLLDVEESVLTYVEGEELVIESWRAGERPRRRTRR